MSLPTLAAVALAALVLSQSAAKFAAKSSLPGQTPGGHAIERPTRPSQMWIDKPVNTALRNDAIGRNSTEIDNYLRQQYMREAAAHPGVHLVAGKAVA